MWFIGYLEHRGDIILVVGHKCSTAVSGTVARHIGLGLVGCEHRQNAGASAKSECSRTRFGESFQG